MKRRMRWKVQTPWGWRYVAERPSEILLAMLHATVTRVMVIS